MATEAKNIVAGELPGLELIDPASAPSDDHRYAVAKPSPSLAALRAKYLGYAADAGLDSIGPQEEVEVRQARPRSNNTDPAINRSTRTLIFSKEGLVGSQG